MLTVTQVTLNVHAEEPIVKRMYTTAYCVGTTTCTGVPVREGICAVKKEWIGKIAIVYEDNDGAPGKVIGIWECLDTGVGADSDGNGIGAIQEGKVIDMYYPTIEKCREHMARTGGRVWVQFVDANG